jgi:uncharacterized protein (DUF934 family)
MTSPLRFRDDAPVLDPAIPFAQFDDQTNAAAVRLEPGDDARALLPFLGRIRLVEVNFPAFTEGRGYSAARILREAGYAGELRALGDIGVDQLVPLRRCGFDAIVPQEPLDRAEVETALAVWPHHYQTAADGAQPIWALRHPANA